jgi:superfamily II DNA or RNA helicase
MQLQPGQLISAPFLPATAEIKKFELRSGYALLEVVLHDGHQTYKPLRITPDQLAQIEILDQGPAAVAANAEDFFFFIEANRIRLAYQFDPQLAVSISQVDPLPHQIEAVYHYLLNSPRVRFLIADDPGAGKTIMAGLVIKELEYRRLAQRVLIVAPGHLKYQWQREMKERFGESFAIVDRGRMDSAWAENVWEERERLITSIDFIKQDAVRGTLRSSRWDLVIVDEAHKMSAYAYPSRNKLKIDKTKRYQVGEILSRQTEHLLFLTATPHRGDDENFRLFLDLLRPGFFAQTGLLKEAVENEENPVFVRRLKEDMRTFDGKPIFPPRHVHTIPFRLTSAEAELYNAVTRYVQEYFDKAKENRSITFALMILQRRLTSSTHAIYKSLQRRKERLEEILSIPEKLRQSRMDFKRYSDLSEDEIEDLPDDERDDIERRLEYLTIADNIEDVQAEIYELERLIDQAREVRKLEIESKLAGLRDQVLPLLEGRKLLIFTEFRDTLDYLTEKLRAWGYGVINIHGQMNMDARIQAEHEFRDQAQILVATEAAGEGINLQVCSLMVNYDIPWNPNRLEQRLGRIHRYGQQYEVHIWNMISKDTREGQILDRLFEKLQAMRDSLGSDRVFDIIGDIIPGARLDELLKDAIFNQRRMDEIEQVIEDVDIRGTQETLERVFMTGLATRHIDYSGLLKESLLAEENRLVPEYVGDYFMRAFRRLGGTIEKRERQTGGLGQALSAYPAGKVFRIASVPYELRRWGQDYAFKTHYGALFRDYRRITFEKAIAHQYAEVEFVAPGHPLLEAVNEQILTALTPGITTTALTPDPSPKFGRGGNGGGVPAFGDPEGQRQGVLWFVEGKVTDGSGVPAGRRVFCFYQPLEGEIQKLNPAVLWDLEPLESPPQPSPYQGAGVRIPQELFILLDRSPAVEDFAITQALLPFREEIGLRRRREAHIKEKYGLRSLDFLIQESNGKILDYQARQAAGEEMDLPLLNEGRNLDSLQARRAELEREICLEGNLTVGEPRLLGAAFVVPLPVAADESQTPEQPIFAGVRETSEEAYGTEDQEVESGADTGVDAERRAEIEAVGMRVAIEYERSQGWSPEDVSGENHGFDIRSTLYDEDGSFADIRYIEVKARAQSGAVRISANEWKKARHFGEKYWLYIIAKAGTALPKLICIQNPTSQFKLDEEIFATGFIVPEKNWRNLIASE